MHYNKARRISPATKVHLVGYNNIILTQFLMLPCKSLLSDIPILGQKPQRFILAYFVRGCPRNFSVTHPEPHTARNISRMFDLRS